MPGMHREISLSAVGIIACLAVIAVPGALQGIGAAQEHAGQYAQADIQFGLRLYGNTCATCHGGNGDGVPGINLRTGQFARAPSDRQLMRLISTGIPGTAMPPGQYSEAELAGLVAYVRTMGEIDPSEVMVGDTERGRAIYNGQGDCARCHRVYGVGSRVAPDLSNIGATRTAGGLERSLLDPTGSMFPINRPVRAVTLDGTVYTGRRLNEDTYTVQLLDQNDRLRSLEKATLREYTLLTTSPMPVYGDMLSAQEVSDVVAYLLSLRGLQD